MPLSEQERLDIEARIAMNREAITLARMIGDRDLEASCEAQLRALQLCLNAGKREVA